MNFEGVHCVRSVRVVSDGGGVSTHQQNAAGGNIRNSWWDAVILLHTETKREITNPPCHNSVNCKFCYKQSPCVRQRHNQNTQTDDLLLVPLSSNYNHKCRWTQTDKRAHGFLLKVDFGWHKKNKERKKKPSSPSLSTLKHGQVQNSWLWPSVV